MINEIYLKKALNIRKDYLDVVNNINRYEEFAQNLLKNISNKSDDLKELQEKINAGRVKSIDKAKDELMSIILGLEEEGNQIEVMVDSMNKKIEKLKEDETSLYRDIKQSYQDLSDSVIKSEVSNYIKNHIQ